MKIGLWLALGIVVWLWVGHARRQRLRQRGPDRSQRRSAASTSASASQPQARIEAIVACADCGVHVPLSDAIVTPAGARFCSEAHRRLHPAA